MPHTCDPRVLVDHTTGDDAGVFRLDDGTLLVQTVDFFTPVVDDPEAFGAIAAANALSDIYAMGGRPVTALSVAGIPGGDFPIEWAAAIFRGGEAKLREAGCALLGGHTVRDSELKFGYAVTGIVEAGSLLTNAGARPGDVIILTKPLGTGILSTALKAGCLADAASMITSMARLNAGAAERARRLGATAATDITGFGLVGHAVNIARESRVTLALVIEDLPLLHGALELALRYPPGGLAANQRFYEPLVQFAADAPKEKRALLFDPQTSGGFS